MMSLAYWRPAGLSTEATDVAVLARKNFGFQFEFTHLTDRLRRSLGRGPGEEDVGAGIVQRDDLRIDAWDR